MDLEPRRCRLRHRRYPLEAWIAGDGPPVVILHGWGLSGGVYRNVLRSIAGRGHQAIAPSWGVAAERPWSLPSVARAVVEILAGLDVLRAPIVGHSFGGVVGVRTTVDHPEFSSALVVCDSPLVSPGRRALVRLALPGRHYRVGAHWSTARALLQNLGRRGGPAGIAGAARWILDGADLSEELRTIRDWAVPAAVLWGEADSVLPRSVGEEAAALLGCGLRVVEGRDGWPHRALPDHDWPLRAPGFFAKRVLETLREISPT